MVAGGVSSSSSTLVRLFLLGVHLASTARAASSSCPAVYANTPQLHRNPQLMLQQPFVFITERISVSDDNDVRKGVGARGLGPPNGFMLVHN